MISNLLAGIVSLLTFPGVMLHEWSHKFICNRIGVPVHRVCYFRLGNPAGYVVHDSVENFGKMLLIATAPFLICSGFAAAIFCLALGPSPPAFLRFALCWLGISVAIHSLPSTEDLNNLYYHARRDFSRNIVALLALPAVWLLKLLRFHDTIWLGLVHAIATLILTALLLRGTKLVF